MDSRPAAKIADFQKIADFEIRFRHHFWTSQTLVQKSIFPKIFRIKSKKGIDIKGILNVNQNY